jgi:hypothetical protein
MHVSPTRHARRVFSLIAIILFIPLAAFAQLPPHEGGSRIRTTDPRVTAALGEGVQRSPTLRELVARIEQGDVVVYLELGQSLPSGLTGALKWIGANDMLRFVQVTVRNRPQSPTLIASIAHELQHVVEVIEAPWVTDSAKLRALYLEIGHRTGLGYELWDTAAARRTTRQVMYELSSPVTASAAENVEDH